MGKLTGDTIWVQSPSECFLSLYSKLPCKADSILAKKETYQLGNLSMCVGPEKTEPKLESEP